MRTKDKPPAKLVAIADELVQELKDLSFSAPVTHVYNPLAYAREAHAEYVTRWGAAPKEVVLLGMNPGPWGMVQTGVPFGEVHHVRSWLEITAPVGKPACEHPRRPVLGLDCPRCEVSGARLWGWARDRFRTPDRFFRRFFVANYCPMTFMETSGRNVTPDKLPSSDRGPLLAACDRALLRTLEHLRPQYVIGVGRFAESRATAVRERMSDRSAVPEHTSIPTIGRILHPSPASPAANKGWPEQATAELRALGIRVPE